MTAMKVNKANCTAITSGTIVDLRVKGLDFPTVITVRYEAGGRTYEIEDSIKLRSEAIKIGFLPVGQKRVPVMGSTSVGSAARVSYNPADPAEAFLTDNIGKCNV